MTDHLFSNVVSTSQSFQHKSKYVNLCWNVKLVCWIELDSECFLADCYQRTMPYLYSLRVSTKQCNHFAALLCTVIHYPSIATNWWVPRKINSRLGSNLWYHLAQKGELGRQIRQLWWNGKILRNKLLELIQEDRKSEKI